MAIIKCKMCGGDLNVREGQTVAVCEHCGTKQTVPLAGSVEKATLFNRANRLRYNCKFDEAAKVYASLVAEFPEEAEGYWGLVLCKYGIGYVDDPATGKKVPTCHRSSFDCVLDDPNFEQALENADAAARKVYREEAHAIEELRKESITISGKEEPYDIFISYKETAENGGRTLDSVLAQDIYDALTEKGYRVFFSRITLEDKLGQEYEPYIFAALNSAKIMLAIGTDYEYYNAVWVKNEWSRYLQLMKRDKTKHLIPCYRNIDPYDMPKEFANLQAQDLGKVGAIQDLLRGIEKLLGTKKAAQPAKETVIIQQSGGPNVESLLKRGNMALEDGDWEKAAKFFDQVLDMNAECAEAYLGIAMADGKCETKEDFSAFYVQNDFSQNRNVKRAKQFGDRPLREYFEKAEAEKVKVAAERKRIAAEKNRLRLALIRKKIEKASRLLTAGYYHTVGLKPDGTAVAVGMNRNSKCDVSLWRDIIAVAAGDDHTVGLKANGTVVAVGSNDNGQCNVSRWSDIVAVTAGCEHTVGLKADGTVVATFSRIMDEEYDHGQSAVSGWMDIVAISASGWHTVGLKADGTVVAVGDNEKGQCNVSGWSDIVAVAAGHLHTVGLKADGTVVTTGSNTFVQHNWSNIVAVAAGCYHIVGLKADGTVVAAGYNGEGQCDVSGWRNIVAVDAGHFHTVGLKSDGTVVTVGKNNYGQCNVSGWKLFKNLDTLDAERKEARERHARELREAEERKRREAETRRRREEKERKRKEEEERKRTQLEEMRKEAARIAAEMARIAAEKAEENRRRLAPIRKEVSHVLAAGSLHTVGLKADGTVVAVGNNSNGECNVSRWSDIVAVTASWKHTVGLKADGTVVAVGDNAKGQCNVSRWSDIVAVAAGGDHTVGLKSDGTVVAVGENTFGQRKVSGWRDIVAVAAGDNHTVGLKSDGTVVAVGANSDGRCNVSHWRDIVAVAAVSSRTVGLKADGTVVAVGSNYDGRCNVSGWRDIIAVAAVLSHTVGLKADGTVVAVGENKYGQCDVSCWRDIVAVAADYNHTVALKADGTVVAVGKNEYGQCDVSGWRDIVAVAAGFAHTVGLKADGTVVVAGYNDSFQRKVSSWKLFQDFHDLEQEKRQARARLHAQWRSTGLCQHCGGDLEGLFRKKCAVCGREKDY